MIRNYVRRDVGQPDGQSESQINSLKLVFKQVMSIPVLGFCLGWKGQYICFVSLEGEGGRGRMER